MDKKAIIKALENLSESSENYSAYLLAGIEASIALIEQMEDEPITKYRAIPEGTIVNPHDGSFIELDPKRVALMVWRDGVFMGYLHINTIEPAEDNVDRLSETEVSNGES
jgi:hypothetical protein